MLVRGILDIHSGDFLFLFLGGGEASPEVCGILFPWPGIEPVSPAVEAWSLNHWTTRDVLIFFLNGDYFSA